MTAPTDVTSPLPRFAVGDRVRVADRPAHGHCRSPKYLRGHDGIITAIHGDFRDPERLAYHRPGLPPRTLYKVRFAPADIWGAAEHADDDLEADIYEHWLAPAGDAPAANEGAT
ncbi:MAG: SH3-like domain-containing protein [Pseudomonadota bacterium]